MKISVPIITCNEESNIEAALRSVDFADEIVVVDSQSTDDTREIAISLGARVLVRPWEGFSRQKQFAVDQCSNDWILSIDADERVSEPLKEEIRSLCLLPDEDLADGYRIPRLTTYMGREIRYGGWYPDRQLRFFRRSRGRWNDRLIHESVAMSEGARLQDLRSDILHHTVEGPVEHQRKIVERYAPLGAAQMRMDGRSTGFLRLAAAAPAAFLRAYFLKFGFLDGIPGLSIAMFSGQHAFLKHLLLWNSQQEGSDGTGHG